MTSLPCQNVALILSCQILSLTQKLKQISWNLDIKKCHKIHVTCVKSKSECPELRVQGCETKLIDSEKYLGDKISSDGKNDINIEDRCNKGLGIKSQALGL